MTLFRLGMLVAALSLCIGLALSNPTIDEYLTFVERELAKAIERSDGAQLARGHGAYASRTAMSC